MMNNSKMTAIVALVSVFGVMLCLSCTDDDVISNDGSTPAAAFTFPEGWGGDWDILLTFSDCDSGFVGATEQIVGKFCPGEAIIINNSEFFTDCASVLTGDTLNLSCDDTYEQGGCIVNLTFEMTVVLDGTSMTGSASWSAQKSGSCDPTLEEVCENIYIEGTRSNPDGCQ